MTPTRRRFLAASLAAAPLRSLAATRHRAAIIGHTGHGNYGHDWDTAWSGLPDVEVVAVADPDEAGRAKAHKRSGAARAYADYRKMLETEKPDVVAICPRWADQRVAMVTAAAAAGAHMMIEKPFAASLEDADRMLAAIETARVKVQVGHTARPDPVTQQVRDLLRSGAIGQLLEIRSRGKEDRRAGGEDLMVLGTHCFDLMRYFAGDPLWVFAHVTDTAREVAPDSGRKPGEPVGTVAGDQVAAMFSFPGGTHGYFGSKANDVATGSRFGVTLYGSRGAIYVPLNQVPEEPAMISRSTSWGGAWEVLQPPLNAKSRYDANVLMVRDLLDAIAKDREPICSARDGRWAVEMVIGIYQSQVAGARVPFPLRDRHNPLVLH
jgi:predicted dehydrogenase